MLLTSYPLEWAPATTGEAGAPAVRYYYPPATPYVYTAVSPSTRTAVKRSPVSRAKVRPRPGARAAKARRGPQSPQALVRQTRELGTRYRRIFAGDHNRLAAYLNVAVSYVAPAALKLPPRGITYRGTRTLGTYTPGRRPQIKIDRTMPPGEIRSVFAHELGHAVLAARGWKVAAGDRGGYWDANEAACHAFAEAFLGMRRGTLQPQKYHHWSK